MFTDSTLQQIESALGTRHPKDDALIHERVTFICDEIKKLKSRKTVKINAEMLEALEEVEKWTSNAFDVDDPDMDLPELEKARAAIKKAKGK